MRDYADKSYLRSKPTKGIGSGNHYELLLSDVFGALMVIAFIFAVILLIDNITK